MRVATLITVGIDDTDVLDAPGTNQLARHLATLLNNSCRVRLITRHQLLKDPRIPCTCQNGCVAVAIIPTSACSPSELEAIIRAEMTTWCPPGSDPGLCIAEGEVSPEVIEFGLRCQREVVTQRDARRLADDCGLRLIGLGGTEEGVIGALAAVGLMTTGNDGRVIYYGDAEVDHFDISGAYPVGRLAEFGVDEVRELVTDILVTRGTVAVGKRLRPSYRHGKIVLFVSRSQHPGLDWFAERVI